MNATSPTSAPTSVPSVNTADDLICARAGRWLSALAHPAAAITIRMLAEQPEAWRERSELCKRCHCDHSTYSRILGDLLDRGWIRVERRRTLRARITPEGLIAASALHLAMTALQQM